MSNPTPTDLLVEELIDAMVCVMNDMGEDGLSVCALVKAKARVAIEPFLKGDYGDMPDLEWAKDVLRGHGEAVEAIMTDDAALREAINERRGG